MLRRQEERHARNNLRRYVSLVLRALDQHDFGSLLHLLDDELFSVGRYIEVANLEVGCEPVEFTPASAVKVDGPQILVVDIPTEHEERARAGQDLGPLAVVAGERPSASFKARLRANAIEMGEAPNRDEWQSTFYRYVADADALYAHAIGAGATALSAPQDMWYGDRVASVRDDAGTTWHIARPA